MTLISFIIFKNNNNTKNFTIVHTKMTDYRQKINNIKQQYKNGVIFKNDELNNILDDRNYSAYIVYRGDIRDKDELHNKLYELNNFYLGNKLYTIKE